MSFNRSVRSDSKGIDRLFRCVLKRSMRNSRLQGWVIVYIDAVDVLDSIRIAITFTRSLPICIFLNLFPKDIHLFSIEKLTAFLAVVSVLSRPISYCILRLIMLFKCLLLESFTYKFNLLIDFLHFLKLHRINHRHLGGVRIVSIRYFYFYYLRRFSLRKSTFCVIHILHHLLTLTTHFT